MNPWNTISLSDYENHMSLKTVHQLQELDTLMERQISSYDIHSLMILGIAGGNGLNHIDKEKITTVYGVDINSDYLSACKKRYPSLSDCLTLIEADLSDTSLALPYADFVIANLLIEYIGTELFVLQMKKVHPSYLSTVIQINTDSTFVSDSPYLSAFNDLSLVHHTVTEETLIKQLETIGYTTIKKEACALPNGKELLRIDFKLN